MSVQELEQPLIPIHTVGEIVDYPLKGNYNQHYQPTYPDKEALGEAVYEVQSTETVTSPHYVDQLQTELTELQRGTINRPLVVTGRCAEEVNLRTSITELGLQAIRNIEIVRSGLGKAIHLLRAMGQSAKPRSAATEIRDNISVPSFMGEMINSQDGDRTPDPSRMVASVVQARDLQAELTHQTGAHVPAAHEALLLPYEMASIFEDPETGKHYLLSADMPWIGKRTNQLDSPHVAMLEGLANPIGIKIGSDSDAEHIAGLQKKLNPDNIDGKLTFMIRVADHEQDALHTIVQAIAQHAPNALLMYDIHGTTKSVGGHKIRAVENIVQEVQMVSDACYDAGLTLHGVHLETIMDDDRLECVETADQIPTHPGGVDPQLNPQQLESVLQQVSDYLLRPARV